MTRVDAAVKGWAPVVAAVCAVVLASGYAWSRKTQAALGINEVSDLGVTLSSTAELARSGARGKERLEWLSTARSDLEARMADSLKPSLVQAELMKSAAGAGVVLREICPLKSLPDRGVEDEMVDCPRYRVTVSGSYEQIAGYLQQCSRQRLPARVTDFRLARHAEGEGLDAKLLTANITVEAFQFAKTKGLDPRKVN